VLGAMAPETKASGALRVRENSYQFFTSLRAEHLQPFRGRIVSFQSEVLALSTLASSTSAELGTIDSCTDPKLT